MEIPVSNQVNGRIDALPTPESLDAAIRAGEARISEALINRRYPEPAGAAANGL